MWGIPAISAPKPEIARRLSLITEPATLPSERPRAVRNLGVSERFFGGQGRERDINPACPPEGVRISGRLFICVFISSSTF